MTFTKTGGWYKSEVEIDKNAYTIQLNRENKKGFNSLLVYASITDDAEHAVIKRYGGDSPANLLINLTNLDHVTKIALYSRTEVTGAKMEVLNVGGGGQPQPLVPPTADKNYLYFQAEEAGSKISFITPSSKSISLQYSTDGVTWNTWNCVTATGFKYYDMITLTNRGDYVFFRGNNNAMGGSSVSTIDQSVRFTMVGKIASGGNIMSLLDSSVQKSNITSQYCFINLFINCASLTTAPSLPATSLATYCYQGMFQGCTSLTTAPSLPVTTLYDNCYNSMFQDCTSLTTAPSLPATTLAANCYQYMFKGCTSLTTAPSLPATTLKNYCYSNMFQGCTSLTTAPSLPATTLASNCYYGMFQSCTVLNSVTVGATSWNSSYSSSWLNGVAATGTFTKPASTTIISGNSGIPSGWTVVNV